MMWLINTSVLAPSGHLDSAIDAAFRGPTIRGAPADGACHRGTIYLLPPAPDFRAISTATARAWLAKTRRWSVTVFTGCLADGPHGRSDWTREP